MKAFRLIQTASLLVAVTGIASAQWTVTNLQPAGATRSEIKGVTGATQYGFAIVGGVSSASVWSGSSSSWVNLHPLNASSSRITGSDGLSHFGEVQNGAFIPSAARWSGNSINWTSLNPPGATSSAINAAFGDQQVGRVTITNFTNEAALWTGTAASFVNLNPTGAISSDAFGIGGNQQVGYALYPGSNYYRASLWTGTAESWKSLHPLGANSSFAYASSGSMQVGIVESNSIGKASLWYGSAESWVDLSPAGSPDSCAFGISGITQVGYVRFVGGGTRASLWRGSSASWVNLHSMLPSEFSESLATSVYSDSSKFSIGGYGFNLVQNQYQALLWTIPIRRISGNMILENTTGGAESGTESITWTLGCGSNTFTGVVDVNQLGGGPYSIEIPPGTPNGAYTLQFKGGTFLSSSYVVNLNGNNITRTIRLRNGDIDQDGEVGPGDFDAVVAQFGGVGNADVDNDGEVGPSDFDIVVANFGLQDQ